MNVKIKLPNFLAVHNVYLREEIKKFLDVSHSSTKQKSDIHNYINLESILFLLS